MKKLAILSILFLFTGPVDAPAGGDHPTTLRPLGSGPPVYPLSREMRTRLKLPARPPVDVDRKHPGRVHPIHPGHKPGRPGPSYPGYGRTGGTTVVQELQPIVVINNPVPVEPLPAPQPQKIWVPPVMETRTLPGYWDYGIKKRWMGDHWRYEQDFGQKNWVPASQVEIVTQAGYWKAVE